jgi:aldehyde dehydrogenase (NAD+)
MTEEIFGPVATLTTFRTPEDAVALANATRYGLAASVWSESIGQALDVASKLKAGVVWVNGANMFDAAAPFGGYRESGFGREGGREGMQAYLAAPPLSGKGGEAAPERRKRCRWPARPGMRSTAPRSSISAASRRGPTAAIPIRHRPERPRRAGRARQPQGHPQRRRGGA